jgi:hypothetical protein
MSTAILRKALVALLTAAGMLIALDLFSQDKGPPATANKQAATPTDKAETAAERDVAAAEQDILKKLGEPTELYFNETPLQDIVLKINHKHKLQIILNQKRLEEANVALDTPVTKSLRGLKLRQAIDLLLRDLGLARVIRGEVLEFTSREAADTHLVIKTYAVGDLRLLDGKDDDEADYAHLRDVLERLIAPESWRDAGGPGTLELIGPVLVANQTIEAQADIARLLARLRQARRQVAEEKGEARLAAVACEADAEDNAKVQAKLRRTVSIDWSETALKDCASALARDYEVPIQISQKKLEEANVSLDTPITLKLSGLSLHAVLDHATRPLGLSWIVRDGVLLLTSQEEADTYLTTRLYPAPDLLALDDDTEDSQRLEAIIANVVHAESWREAGGPGDILRLEGLSCLVCRQTRAVHEEIDRLLASTRKDAAASAGAPRGAEDRMVLRAYVILDPALLIARETGGVPPKLIKIEAAADVAKIVRELVAPESWDAKDSQAYLRPLANRLIVRQTPKAHRQIRALLAKLGVLTENESTVTGSGGGFF